MTTISEILAQRPDAFEIAKLPGRFNLIPPVKLICIKNFIGDWGHFIKMGQVYYTNCLDTGTGMIRVTTPAIWIPPSHFDIAEPQSTI